MVGVPRSKGCRICVTRRVKCDLTRPTCNNCKKGNRPCPGYDSDLKFQDEGERLRKRFARKEQNQAQLLSAADTPALDPFAASSSSASPESTVWPAVDETGIPVVGPQDLVPHRNSVFAFLEASRSDEIEDQQEINVDSDDAVTKARAAHEQPVSLRHQHRFVDIDSLLLSPTIAQEALLYQFYASLSPSSQAVALPHQLRNHGRWISHLPTLTGRNQLLDTAVRAVTLAHLARRENSDVFLHESRPLYGKAIRYLTSALSDEKQGMASETLSATILLSFYEMFASDSNDAWVRHAGGAGALIRIRGPERHRHGFDREMFLAFRHTVIVESFETGEICFLGEPEWRALSRDIHQEIRGSGLNANLTEFFDLTEDFYEQMLVLPTLLYESKHLTAVYKTKRKELPAIFELLQDLVKRCDESRQGLKAFYAKFRLCLVKLKYDLQSIVSGDPVIPIYYNYPNVMVASTCTGLWTVLIILNFILLDLEKSNPDKVALYKVENRECGLEICRSTSYLLTSSFLGPFFLIQGLRVCLLAFEHPDEREWVIKKLFQIGQTHMAMASHIPSFSPGDTQPDVTAKVNEWGGLPTLGDLTKP